MKKIIFALGLVLSLTLALCACDTAPDVSEIEKNEESALEFTSNGDGSCYVSGIGSCTDTHITVPYFSPAGDVVVDISENAFDEFTAVTDLTLPDSITSIATLRMHALGRCPALKNVYVSENHPLYKSVDGVIYHKEQPSITWYPCGRTESSYTVPDGIYIITDFAFEFAVYLKEIILPDECTHIGTGAFRGCTSLESIAIPDGTPAIYNGSFTGCTSLRSIVIPASVTKIGNLAFAQCSLLIDVYYGGSKEDWEKVDVGMHNENLFGTAFYFNYDVNN